jgi:hypothetical protein
MSSPEAASPRALAIGIALGVLATALIYGHAIGLGFTLYVVANLVALVLHARLQKVQLVYRNLVLVVPVLFFAAMLAIRADTFLTFLNLGAGTVALILLVYFLTEGSVLRQSIFDHPINTAAGAADILHQPIQEIAGARVWLASHRNAWNSLLPFLRGLVITIPLVVIFVLLLSSADEVFARLVTNVVSAFLPQDVGDGVLRITSIVMFGWLATGTLAASLLERGKAKRAPQPPEAPESAGESAQDLEKEKTPPVPVVQIRIGFTEASMALGGVCLVFGAFVVVQFVYLFGGQSNITNFSYAEYARRGFAELVAVGVLTLGLVYFFNEVVTRDSTHQNNVFRALNTPLVLLTCVILVSAFQRLRLYELTYGFTTLRLIIFVSIVWLGILLLGILVSLYWITPTVNVFGLTVLISVFGFVATLDVLNPDAFVASEYLGRGDIDPLYLSTLSVEAAPLLVNLVDAAEPGVRSIVRDTLYDYWLQLDSSRSGSDWRDYNLARSNALAVLSSVQAKLERPRSRSDGTWYQVEDFQSFLRQGMTIRAVTRQFGYPFTFLGPDNSNPGRQITARLIYRLDEKRLIVLEFDTARGLESACLAGRDSNTPCTLLNLPPSR